MLTERDYELLSAYIDGTLNETERTALESRLQAEDELRRELEGLRATIALVKGLPTLKAPRNFTLDTRQIRRSSARWLVFPTSAAFSAISVAAATILIAISALLFNQSARIIPASGLGAASNTQSQTAQQEIALIPTETAIPSDIAQTTTALSINGGLTITAQVEETQKQFRAEMTATALSSVVGQANSAAGGESDMAADQAAGAAMPVQAPTLEAEAADAILSTNVALQSAPSEGNIPATAITNGFLMRATALPDAASDLAQFGATALPPAPSIMLEVAVTATPALELSRERQRTPTPLPTLVPPGTAQLTSTMLPTATLSAPPTSPTLLPATQVAIVATTAPTADVQGRVASPTIVPLMLLVAGLSLLIIAIGTTLVRRRR